MRRKVIILSAAAAAILATGVVAWRMHTKPAAKPTVASAPASIGPTGMGRPAGDEAPQPREDGSWTTAALTVDDDPAGTLRLEGQVVGASDAPVADAVVTIDSNPARTTKTTADGAFFFDQLVARPYILVATHDSGVGGPVQVRLNATNDPVVLRLHPAPSVVVTAVGAQAGTPIPDVAVELRALAVLTATTDAQGQATFAAVPPALYLLVATAPGRATVLQQLQVTSGNQEVRLELRDGGAVAGVVVDDGGAPVAGAEISYVRASESGVVPDPRRDGAKSDAQGAFRLEGLAAGTIRVTARDGSHAPAQSAGVTVVAGQQTDGVRVVLEQGAVVAGRVVTPSGEGVPGAQVRVTTSLEALTADEARQTYTDDEGAFKLGGLPRERLAILALSEQGSSEPVNVNAKTTPDQRAVRIVLGLTGEIAGTVVDSAGEPVEGAQIWAAATLGNTTAVSDLRLRGPTRALSDAGGGFTLHGLRPGRYELRAGAPHDPSPATAWTRVPTKATAGDREVRLVLAGDGALSGTLAFDDEGAPDLFSVSLGGGARTPVAPKHGAFTVTPVPPGEYTVLFSGPGFDDREVSGVTVKSDQTLDLGTIHVHRGRRLVGRVLTPDGRPVPGATVAAGRRLLGSGASVQGPSAPGFDSARRTTSDAAGSFVLAGVGGGELTLVAEHEQLGRSAPTRIPGGDGAQPVDIVLSPYAALEGKVTRGGAPFAGAMVNANSTTVPGTVFVVVAAADGTFRFDKLAADTYSLAAVSADNPMKGFGLYTRVVVVAAGQTVHADLAVDEGTITLVVDVKAERRLTFAQVFTFSGAASPKNGLELDQAQASATAGDRFWSVAYNLGWEPTKVERLKPGPYSVCVMPVPTELTEPGPVWAYIAREGDRMPVFCTPVEVAPAPVQQALEIQVTIPALVGGSS